MWYDRLIEQRLATLEVQYFLHDPEGCEDRAGDGYYYREPGKDSWSGSWFDEDEAIEMAREVFEEEYQLIDWKKHHLDGAGENGLVRYLVRGKSRRRDLGHDAFAIYWSKRVKGGKFAFSMLVLGRDESGARANVVQRLGDTATFTLEAVEGDLDLICATHGLEHPVALAERAVFGPPPSIGLPLGPLVQKSSGRRNKRRPH